MKNTLLMLGCGLIAAPPSIAQTPKTAVVATGPRVVPQFETWVRVENRADALFDHSRRQDPQDEIRRTRLTLKVVDPKQGERLFLQPQSVYRRTSHVSLGAQTSDETIHQAYVTLGGPRLKWRLGRQEVTLGDGRLVGTSNWGNTGRSFDIVRVSRAGKNGGLELLAGKLGDVVAKKENPTFAALYVTPPPKAKNASDLYLLYKGDTVTGTAQRIWTAGARPRFTLANGISGTAEAAYQFGEVGGRSIAAHAYAVNAGYSFAGRAGLRISVERDFASGGDPKDSKRVRTFDQLFASNHSLYGVMDLMGWRNMQSWKLAVRGKASSKLGVAVEGSSFGLSDPRDYWYGDNGKPIKGSDGASLRDATGTAPRHIGDELDLIVDYSADSRMRFSGGLGWFQPGAFVRRVNSGHADGSHWFFFQTNYTY